MTDAATPTAAETATPMTSRIEPGAVAASALALGALALPDHTRMSPGRRHLLRLGRAAYVGWYTWDVARRTPWPQLPAPVLGAVGGAAATLATAPVDEAVDGWMADRLRSWGVRRPRLALALAGVGIGAALALDNQLRPSPDDASEWVEPDELFETVEVPDHARALLEAMLDAGAATRSAEAAGQTVAPAGLAVPAGLTEAAAILREQLDQARATVLRDQPMTTDVHFQIVDDVPRVVPHTQTWPVRAHFEAGGVPLQVELWIGDGHLSGLSIMQRSDDLAEDDERWSVDILEVLEAWPAPAEVRLVLETADGSRPVG